MSKRYKAKRRQRYYEQRCVCQRCGERAIECRLQSWNKRPDEMLCPQHARKAGYCPGCGQFWAGVDSFDFSRSGLCEHCQVEVESDNYELEDGEFGEFEERGYCDTCCNTGYLNCFCGGDICVCENHGEYPCPDCG